MLFMHICNAGELSICREELLLQLDITVQSGNGHYCISRCEAYVLSMAIKAALLLKKDLGNKYVLKEQFRRDGFPNWWDYSEAVLCMTGLKSII